MTETLSARCSEMIQNYSGFCEISKRPLVCSHDWGSICTAHEWSLLTCELHMLWYVLVWTTYVLVWRFRPVCIHVPIAIYLHCWNFITYKLHAKYGKHALGSEFVLICYTTPPHCGEFLEQSGCQWHDRSGGEQISTSKPPECLEGCFFGRGDGNTPYAPRMFLAKFRLF